MSKQPNTNMTKWPNSHTHDCVCIECSFKSQSNLIDQVIEWAEENNFLSSKSNDEEYAVSLSDLSNYLQKLKENHV